jgi:hypothetical protein
MWNMTEVDRPIIDMTLDRKKSTKNKRVYSGGSVDTAAVLDAIRPKNKGGRPTVMTPDVKDKVLDYIANGKSVAEISRMDGMPSDWAIFQCVAKDEAFARLYMHAREKQQFVLADRALAIAAGTDPLCFRELPDGTVEMLDAGERRLIMDTVRWQTGKLAARVFGDRVAVTGADGGAVQIEASRKVDLASLPPEQLAQFEAMLRALPKPGDGDKQ